jgi:hypothetical protein
MTKSRVNGKERCETEKSLRMGKDIGYVRLRENEARCRITVMKCIQRVIKKLMVLLQWKQTQGEKIAKFEDIPASDLEHLLRCVDSYERK